MRKRSLTRRATAFQLVLALAASSAGRVVLDSRTLPDAQKQFEVEHRHCCVTAHDHSLCVLVYHAPWSADASIPRVEISAPPIAVAPSAARLEAGHEPARLELARSPPALS